VETDNETVLVHPIKPPGQVLACADARVAAARLNQREPGVVVPRSVVIVSSIDTGVYCGRAASCRRAKAAIAEIQDRALQRYSKPLGKPADLLPQRGRESCVLPLFVADVEPPGAPDSLATQESTPFWCCGKCLTLRAADLV